MSAPGDLANPAPATPPTPSTPPAPGSAGRGRLGTAFIWVARIEAATWFALLVAMVFKYSLTENEIGVQIVGPIHGVAFLTYVGLTLAVAITRRWGVGLTLLGLAASIPPMMTWPFERWVERTGRLSR